MHPLVKIPNTTDISAMMMCMYGMMMPCENVRCLDRTLKRD
jgi:hypothetical protein